MKKIVTYFQNVKDLLSSISLVCYRIQFLFEELNKKIESASIQ